MAGIIFLPILVTMIISLILIEDNRNRDEIPGYDEVFKNADADYLVNPETWGLVQWKLTYSKPKDVEYAVFTKDYKNIISTIELCQQGKQYNEIDILTLIKTEAYFYAYQIEYIQDYDNENKTLGENGLWMVTRVLRKSFQHPKKIHNPFFISATILTVLFAFCIVMVLVITRSITSSVTLLEQYTRKIANGSLDPDEKPVRIKGSNEIASLITSLNTMKEKLDENEKKRMRFIMGISHDLRTPIALIKGYAEALNDGMIKDGETKKNSLSIIITKADMLNDRIDELIDFVKLNTHEWRQNLSNHKVKPFLEDFSKRFTLDCELMHRNFTADLNIPDDLEIAYDEKLFTRILENLTGNACRYTQENGNIRLKACFQNESLTVSLIDDGIGIKKEDLPYVFEPLYRGTNSRQEDGKGLGLSVVKSIVESHGWQINAASEGQGQGSIFVLKIEL